MSPTIYYTYTVGMWTLQIIMAILIDDITIIFGFFAAISESMLNFILPGLFYIYSCRVGGVKPNKGWLVVSWLFVGVGVGIFVTANCNNVNKIINS